MQIRKLHIDGFGAFADHPVEGFTSGINVIYGSNEFGKTTLLEFIRRILFGFPDKRSAGVNPYPALRGGTYGGKLISEMANGERLVISRTLGQYKKGDVSVLTSSGLRHGQENLNAFLSHASQELYQNIFAFSLDELQAFGSLQGDDIKTHIYGAGMGLGAKSIIKIAKDFREQGDELFKPRGKTQKMVLLLNDMKNLQREIGEMQKHLAQYDEFQVKAEKLEQKKIEQERTAQKLETQKRVLETKLDLYSVYVELKEGEEELARLGDTPDFPEHAFETLGVLKSELKNLQSGIVEENENREKLTVRRDGIFVNEELFGRQEAVASLRNMTEQIRVIVSDWVDVSRQRDQLKDQIQAEIEEIGTGWDESVVEDFEITQAEKGEIQVYQEDLVDSRQNLNRAKEKLEEYRQQKAKEISRGVNIPEWLKVISYSLLGLGAAGLAWAGLISSFPLLVFSLITVVLGVICVRMIYKKKDTLVREDQLEPLLATQLTRAQKREDEKFAKWRAWLKEKKLDELMIPTSAQEVMGSIKRIKDQLRQKADLNKRLERMRETMDKADGLVSEISPCLKNSALELDIGVAIDVISLAFEEAEKNQAKRSGLQSQLDALEGKIPRLMEQMKEKEKSLRDFIRSADASDDKDFETKYRQCEKKKSLQKTANEKSRFIQSRVGLGKAYEDFLESVKNTHPEEIQQELDHISSQWGKSQEAKDRANQQMGEIRNALNQLVSDDDLLIKQSELKIKNEQLKMCSREWTTNKIAHFMLERAKQKYERERQPEVIRAAENIFSRITSGRYNRIFKPLDNDEILIDNESRQRRGVVEMSRGTREQLYLAMRLGLIEEYEKRSEPLPVIMDDVLVNFDDDRALSVMQILKDFAATRQVIVLSCHRQSLENYKRLGASQVAV